MGKLKIYLHLLKYRISKKTPVKDLDIKLYFTMGDDPSRRVGFGGLGGLGGFSAPPTDSNVPLTSGGGVVSPYLNFDPALINPTNQDAFIFPEGIGSRQRGRFELAFSMIGGSVLTGGAVGAGLGFFSGVAEARNLEYKGTLRRTQILNHITKRAAASAQMLGVVALMYSVFGVAISKCRDTEDDAINTISAATLTGFLFKSSAGWKKCLRGGVAGAVIGGAYLAITSSKKFTDYVEDSMNNARLKRY